MTIGQVRHLLDEIAVLEKQKKKLWGAAFNAIEQRIKELLEIEIAPTADAEEE